MTKTITVHSDIRRCGLPTGHYQHHNKSHRQATAGTIRNEVINTWDSQEPQSR